MKDVNIKKRKLEAAAPVKPMQKSKGKAKATPIQAATPSSSGSGSEEDSEEEDEEERRRRMLEALEAHGRAMFGGDDGPVKRVKLDDDLEDEDEDEEEDEFQSDDGEDMETLARKAEEESDDDDDDESEEEVQPPRGKASKVETVVFAPTNTSTSNFTKAEKRAFMSHKSTKMLAEAGQSSSADVKTSATIDPTEASNLNLDKALHSMLLTNLLPNAAEASRPSEKRNAMSGRLMELASLALPGTGSSSLSETSLSSHPARVRTGILKAQASRAEAARLEAQAAGSWVKGAGGLGDGVRGSSSNGKRGGGLGAGFSGGGGKNREKGMAGGKGVSRDRGEREKGLGMGIGRFEGGMLKLSKAEIERGSARPERGRGRGRGGKGGRGGRGGRGGSSGGGGGIRAKSTSH